MSGLDQAVTRIEKPIQELQKAFVSLTDSSSNARWQEMNKITFSNSDVNSILNNGFTLVDDSKTFEPPARRAEKDKVQHSDSHPHHHHQTKWDHEKHNFSKSNGVEVVQHNNKLEYHLKGHKEALFTTDASEKGLQEADHKLKQMVQQKEAELHKKYGATFSINGENAGKQQILSKGGWVNGTDDVKCRAPNIEEITAIDRALQHSQPTAHNVKFYITTNEYYKNTGDIADYSSVPSGDSHNTAKAGSPAVFINGRNADVYQPDEIPGKIPQLTKDHKSLQHVITHELAHHSAASMGWNDDSGPNIEGQKLANAMGWRSPVPHTNDTNEWMLEDKQGHLWKKIETGNQWTRCDQTGHPIDAKGNKVSETTAEHCDLGTLKIKADLAPSSFYFDTPQEMYAEALATFRVGPEQRMNLAHSNRKLYNIIKNEDQAEINKAHPVDPITHQPTYVRDVNGNVVPNSQAVQNVLQTFEPLP
jgi:hypothetical protein